MTRPFARDLGLALLLAAVMGVGWTLADRAALAALRLPDTDDLMRLVQVRDWLAGQGWRDLAQHRLGDLPMHWTRLADLGPAALIAALSPPLGRHAAEVAAVVAWPLLLFAVALLLVARIARALDPRLTATATVVAALAFPATTVFMPGRIDHHGLQLVLLLAAVLAQLGAPTPARGATIGLAAAASLAIGLETIPFLAATGALAIAEWVRGERPRAWLAGLAAGAAGGLALAAAAFAPVAFGYPACDGFTLDAWRAAGVLALALIVLAAWAPPAGRARAGWAAAVLLAAAAIAALVSPRCLAPYGAVDPRLAAAWLSRVGEAQPLAAAPWATAIGYAGLLLVGSAATGWAWWRRREAGWLLLLVLALASLATTLWQLRGAYAGALVVAPGLAVMIERARRRGAVAQVAAWLVSAGVVHAGASTMLPTPPAPPAGSCLTPVLAQALARLPRGRVLAPIDDGPAILAATAHHVLAAPYHRNAEGTLAMLAAYRAPPDGVAGAEPRYALACPATRGPSGSLAAAFAAGAAPGWRPLARDGDARLWALSASAAPR